MTHLLLAAASLAAIVTSQDTTLRVNVTLVQVDAIVKDRKGKQVQNLTRDDFEILEGGKPRKISNFSYIRSIGGVSPAATGSPVALPSAGRHRQQQPRRENIQRTIALVVDDIKMSFDSLQPTRLALKKFVDEQLEPTDLVAIVPTSSVSALQQFTTDKRALHAAIGRIRLQFLPGSDSQEPSLQAMNSVEGAVGAALSRRFAIGTLGAMKYIIEGMRTMPGRKSVVLFSDGFTMYRSPGQPQPPVNTSDVRQVTDSANRSAVVIYGIDARGLIYPGLQAKDDVSNMEREEVVNALNARSAKLGHNQDGIKFLAEETGGLAQYNDNDLNGGLGRMLEDQSGYYLIGFPRNSDDSDSKLRKITLRLKNHPELKLRYRRGPIDTGDAEPAAAEPKTPGAILLAALNSPFVGNTVGLRLTPSFVLTDKGKPAIRALLHIRAPQLGFSDPAPDGFRMANLLVLGVTDGASTEKSFTIRVKDDPQALERVRQNGFVYALEHEVKNHGPNQLRIAVMDGSNQETGSASQYLEIPDLRKGQLATSGLSMAAGDVRDSNTQAEDLSAAVRMFDRDKPFSYGLTIYNSKPGITIQPRLLSEGKVVWTGKPFVVNSAGSNGTPAGGVLRLGQKTDPGAYSLEVQVFEGLKLVSAQYIDFDLR